MGPIDWMDARSVSAQGRGGEEESAASGAVADLGEILDGLNDPQREAVTHGEGPLLILAGAGSGKTRVITRRIAWLIASGRCRAGEVLAITFTNKAAGEMRSRVEGLIVAPHMWISTFHSMCARILRREIEVLGGWTRDFTIYDTHDRNRLLKRLIQDAGWDVQRFRPSWVGGRISDEKNRTHVDGEGGVDLSGLERDVLDSVREGYEAAMRASNALDFDDLLLKTLRIFDEHPGVRDAYASRFRYALVDEYQDTNRVQYLLTRHLAGWHGNLAVCGDPDQSIYAWRGADVRNILDFEKDFGRAAVVKLEQNYRSTGNVLKAAQALICHNVGRKEKDLWTERADGEPLVAVECGDEDDEAATIAAEVRALVAEGFDRGGIAVFYRVNFMQRALERAFRLSGVSYQIVGGLEFYQRREIRDLIAYLQMIVNPRDDVALRRVINVPARGVGERSVAALDAWAAERGLRLADALGSAEARSTVRGRGRRGLESLSELLVRLEGLGDGPASEALERVIDETDYMDHLATLGDPDPTGRRENVEELVSHARTYDGANPDGRLRGFLQDVALISDVDAFEEDEERVTLMTLHSAKGLEFPVVFVAGVEEGFLPHARALEGDEEDGLEEERRLLYVGMTRAMDRLYLTWALRRLHYGTSGFRIRSRFLDEIPPERIAGFAAPSPGEEEDGEDDVLGGYDPPDDACEVHEGAWVVHEHFGRGRVQRLQGSGINARATVAFDEVGSKVLLLQYARLEVLGS